MKTWFFLLTNSLPAAAQSVESPALPPVGVPFYNTGYPEASACQLTAGGLLVGDNEIPSLALFRTGELSSSATRSTLRSAASPIYPVEDMEGMTVIRTNPGPDGKPSIWHVIIGSHSRSKGKGKVMPARQVLMALQVDGKSFTPAAAVKVNRSLADQIRVLALANERTPWGPILRESIRAKAAAPDAPDIQLTGAAGLNIEGLTITKSGTGLMLGLRSPLVERKAVLIPVLNAAAALDLHSPAPQPAQLGEPVLLDLGGRGIRSMEWDASLDRYWIAAGVAGEGTESFTLYLWTGDPAQPPQQITTPSAGACAGLEPEGLAPVGDGRSAIIVGDGSAGSPWHAGMVVEAAPPAAK